MILDNIPQIIILFVVGFDALLIVKQMILLNLFLLHTLLQMVTTLLLLAPYGMFTLWFCLIILLIL